VIHGKRVTINGSTFYRVTKSNPCDVCDHADWCRRFEDGYTECMRVDNSRPTRSGGWLHWTGSSVEPSGDWRERVSIIPPATVEERAPIDPILCDEVYTFVLNRFPLSDEHRQHFHDRKFTDKMIEAGRYGSLTVEARDRVAAEAVEHFGESIIGTVPGFTRKKDGSPSLYAHAGTLIPSIDDLDRAYRLRVRPDDQVKLAEGKYRHVSSPECSSGANLHFARPRHRTGQDVRVGIVEGEIKANYAARRLNMTVIARPGVGVNADVIPALERLGAKEVWILDDMDTFTNPAVAAHESRLTDDLIAAGYVVRRGIWDEQYKGIDDALAAGVLPVLEPRPLMVPNEQKEQEIFELKKELRELRDFHSAYVAANRAPHLGQERSTAAAIIVDLSTVPVGEWKAMPHRRIAEQAGISERAVPRQIKTVQPVINDVVELKKEWVPETVDRDTGEIRGGHLMTFARLKTDRIAALKVIATGVPEKGHKSNHGGKRLPCPVCGDAGRVRRWVDHCAKCDLILDTGETLIKPSDCQDVGISLDTATDPGYAPQEPVETSDRQDDMFIDNPLSVTVLSPATLASSHNDDDDGNWQEESQTDSIADAWLNGRKIPQSPPPLVKTLPPTDPESGFRGRGHVLFSCRSPEEQARILAGERAQS